ncbi:hypothetical protein TWF696_003308 [Orbilia brochopaga]|uniref:Zn(2)-C6 fungal-type domain-containing protein n=1 Tax=Orbilia brochopaga TaxID=3140254 RepID=A0AAV9TYF3_9PEZI
MPKRACDGCSIRKIRCEGIQPCRACSKAGLPCTFLKALRKGGPRKPTARTIEAIKRTQEEYARDLDSDGLPIHPPPGPGLIDEDTDPESTEPTPLGSPLQTFRSPGLGYRNGNGISLPVNLTPTCTYLEAEQDGIGLGQGLSTATKYPTPVLAIYLEIYHHRLYPVWPILKWEPFLAELEARPNDPEIYALATALASAVMGQLQLPQWKQQYIDPETQITKTIIVSTEHFAAEALRARRLFEWRERPGIYAILTSLFFHVYYENLGKTPASSLALREAITFVQIMNLDRESGYQGLSPEDAELQRRLFWLIFVTERGHSIVHDLPFVLTKTIKLPNPDIDKEPLLASFMNLASLFANFDKSVIDAWTSRNTDDAPSLERLQQLQSKLKDVHPHKTHTNEVQKADVLVTKHWMRTLVWQVSMQQGFLAGSAEKADNEAMTLSFPLKIAEELLATLAHISRGAIESHGPGMQSKLFEITNSLADVILCIPNIKSSPASSIMLPWTPTPVDYLKSLVDLMHFRTSSNPQLLRIILSKTSSILSPPDPLRDQRLLELPSSTRPSPESPGSASTEATRTPAAVVDETQILPVPTSVDDAGSVPATLIAVDPVSLDLGQDGELSFPPADMMEYTTSGATPTTPTAAPIVSGLNSPVVTPPPATTSGAGPAYLTSTYGTQELMTAPPGFDASWFLAGSVNDWVRSGDSSRYPSGLNSPVRSEERDIRNWMNGVDLSQSSSAH